MKGFIETDPARVQGNFIDMIGNGWMLITAGDEGGFNTMTASWGGVGEIWGKHMAVCLIRPQRHTKKFVDSSDRLTLSFFDAKYREALAYCGSHSGRDEDKISNAGLTVVFSDSGTPAIGQANLVLECRKMYVGELRGDGFLDVGLIEKWYPEQDFHHVYICEIERAWLAG